jgi:capsular polysaccharide transport system permease protein
MSDTSAKKQKNKLYFIVIVVVPMVLALIYYAAFAVDRYVSYAEIAVRQTDGNNAAASSPGLALLTGAINPTSREETLYLRQYIMSMDMLGVLQDELGWKEHYSAREQDPLYWLSGDAADESALKYYQRVVKVFFETETGLLQVEVQAFEPEYAKKVLEIILRESERFVNELSQQMTRDQLSFVERELVNSLKNYELKRDELLMFQAQNNLLDAEETVTARSATIAGMEAQLAAERAKLGALRSVLSGTAPQVQQQERMIAALERQVVTETQRLIAQDGSSSLNTVAAKFRELNIQASIAEEAYKVSLASLENTRIEINKKFRTLAVIVSPNMPDSAIYPKRIYNLVALLIVLFALLGIVRFIIAIIEDHRD